MSSILVVPSGYMKGGKNLGDYTMLEALNFTGGIANGDVITALRGSGVEVIACNTTVGCSLVTLQIQ